MVPSTKLLSYLTPPGVEAWTPRFLGPQPQQALLALVTQQPHRSMQQQQLRWWRNGAQL